MDKCVLCKRCVRTCIDLQEVGVLEAINRGDKTRIGTFMDKPLAMYLYQLWSVYK
jgi:NADH-quinone oxidoreductase subunit G/[NiFe] hydrogenase diaphorase moiety small subunit